MNLKSLTEVQFGSYLIVSSPTVHKNITRLAEALNSHSGGDRASRIGIHAVLKTNGYETDLAMAAHAIAEFGTVDALCVATVAEAKQLLALGLYRPATTLPMGYEALPIIVLGDMKCATTNDLNELPPQVKFICRGDADVARIVDANKRRALSNDAPRLQNFIGVDIGMRRGDADLAKAEQIAEEAHAAQKSDRGWILGGVIGHFSSAGLADICERDRRMNEETERFNKICERVSAYLPADACYSLPATDGALLHGFGRYGNTVRIGKGLYGIEPPPASQQCSVQLSTAACVVGVIHGIHKVEDYHGYNRIPVNSSLRLARVGIMGMPHPMKGLRLRVVPQNELFFPENMSHSEYITVFNQDQNTLYLDVGNTQTKVGDCIVIVEPNPKHENSWTKTSSRIAQSIITLGESFSNSMAAKISEQLRATDTNNDSKVREILKGLPNFKTLSGTQYMMDMSRSVSKKIWLAVELERLSC